MLLLSLTCLNEKLDFIIFACLNNEKFKMLYLYMFKGNKKSWLEMHGLIFVIP